MIKKSDKSTYREIREIDIIEKYDVIVVGAGVAGISASISATRRHKKVLLIEKSAIPGGLATLGLIAIYLPLCDGRGKKVIGGIAEELLKLSIKYGYNNLPDEWERETHLRKNTKKRYQTEFSVPECIVALEEKLLDEGIDILYDTLFSDVVMDKKKCIGLIVENKSGRIMYRCKAVIDATGDADVFYKAGVRCIERDNWLSFWSYETNLEAMAKAIEEKDIKKGILLRTYGADNTGKGQPEGERKFRGCDGEEVTEYLIKSRQLALKKLKERDKKSESFLSFPGMAQMRTTRRIEGVSTLNKDDEGQYFDDSIGCAGDWRKAGKIYEIPYGTLISPNAKNIFAAGRIISSADDAWEVTRVIPVAAMTGEAAGLAAALATESDLDVNEVDIGVLQNRLRENGVIIHEKDI